MNLPDILSIACTGGCEQSDTIHGLSCMGCEIRVLAKAVETAKKRKFKQYPYDTKSYLMQWIIGRACVPMPTITNLHAIALIEHYELNL